MKSLPLPRRYSVRALLAVTFLIAIVLGWCVAIERSRSRFIADIERAGGRIKYHPWSPLRPLRSSRLHFVTLPQSEVASLDLEQLLDFPAFAEFGVNDVTIRVSGGGKLTCASMGCTRQQLHGFLRVLTKQRSAAQDSSR